MANQSKPRILISSINQIEFDVEQVEKFALKSFFEQAYDLNIDSTGFDEIKIILNNMQSSVQGDEVFINVKNCKSVIESLEIIFPHEITHYLIDSAWGNRETNYPVIFWEGIPTFFADNKLRLKRNGISYHDLCRSLFDQSLLLPLKKIMLSHHYYGYRVDLRADSQSASFIGFLFEVYGLEPLREILKNFTMPTPFNPFLRINQFLRKSFGKDLKELEKDWHSFLRNGTICPIAEKIINGIKFQKLNKLKNIHCKFCSFPIKSHKLICLKCNSDNKLKILLDK